MLTTEKLARLSHFCEQTWDLLSPNEQERYYCDTGIIGFIEDCMTILQIYPSQITVEQMDYLCDILLACEADKRSGHIFASYIPTDDISVIFEERFNEDGEVDKLMLRGFYYGEPNDDDNKAFYNDYDAHFS